MRRIDGAHARTDAPKTSRRDGFVRRIGCLVFLGGGGGKVRKPSRVHSRVEKRFPRWRVADERTPFVFPGGDASDDATRRDAMRRDATRRDATGVGRDWTRANGHERSIRFGWVETRDATRPSVRPSPGDRPPKRSRFLTRAVRPTDRRSVRPTVRPTVDHRAGRAGGRGPRETDRERRTEWTRRLDCRDARVGGATGLID